MEISKETLEIICEALSERSRATSEAARTALTQSMRKAADEDFKKTHKAWEEIEKIKREAK
jgi:hypothetical protein